MSNFKPIKTTCWIKFLILQGCERKKDNGGSHSMYKKAGVLTSKFEKPDLKILIK